MYSKIVLVIIFTLAFQICTYSESNSISKQLSSGLDSTQFQHDTLKKTDIIKENLPIKVEVVQFPKNDILDKLTDFVIGIIPVIVAVIIGWWLNERRLRKQDFESNIFKLLETQDEIRDNISILYEQGEFTKEPYIGASFFTWGMDYTKNLYLFQKTYSPMEKSRFISLLRDYKHNFLDSFYDNGIARTLSGEDLKDKKVQEDMAAYTYIQFFDLYFNELGHYFRHLFTILKYIERNEKTIKRFGEIDFYYGMIQARMSASELYFLFYDGLIFPKMKQFIENYKLVENLAVEDLMEESHQLFYKYKMKSRKTLQETYNKKFLGINDGSSQAK